ncbi:hypothetical protein Aph01nite_56230 [Acrocarpospora phusangensis]|uniref:Uncharacterized protein n=1 Tax=Acrocarpospora phusangensis TaxID=1070424 RepID=A0A919QGV7_9ACTN|nr:sialidase family protein [Acrocarpospora phusangensis]GIH27313.1 hypothetical protein Aph01nite_56230 [Acrocarpospora phusangensis]
MSPQDEEPAESPPALHHSPPGPSAEPAPERPFRPAGSSPWMLPPFGAPVPEDAAGSEDTRDGDLDGLDDTGEHTWSPNPRTGRRPYGDPPREPEFRHGHPYSRPEPPDPEPRTGRPPYGEQPRPQPSWSWQAEVDEEQPQRPPRRLVTRPDKLVASGPPPTGIRRSPEIQAEPEEIPQPEREPAHRLPYRPPPLAPAPPPPPPPPPPQRIGRPPGGRPARPDVLVSLGPPRGGRHHRRVARAPRRSFALPLLVLVSLIAVAAVGVFVYQWAGTPTATGITLAVGDGQSGDSAFAAPGQPGNGSRQLLTSVASAGSTIVAVGTDTTSAIARPLFIVSDNGGKDWQLGNVIGPPGYEPVPGSPGRVAGGSGRWLAVGTDEPGPEGRGMWTSADGRTWTAVDPVRLSPFLGQDRITDLARTATGFVAVGTTVLPDGTLGAVAWVSPDGQSWSRVDNARIGTSDKIRGIQSVIAKGDQVVALADPGTGTATVILRSDDGGATWLRTATEIPDIRPEPGALAVGKGGFVLVPTGQRFGGDGVPVHCSPDGGQWRACGTIGPLSPQGTGVRGLASSSAGIAAVAESAWEEYVAFRSGDGKKWAKSTDLGHIPGTLRAVTMTGSGLLVAGGDARGPGDVENLAVLMTAEKGKAARAVPLEAVAGLNRLARNTASVLASGGAFVAVGSANGDAGIWTSGNNGANWKAIESEWLGGLGRQALTDVAHGEKGWLAVGSTMADPVITKPLLVTSADGRAWRQGPVIDVPEGHLFLAPRTVAAGSRGYVLAGEDQTASGIVPALWFTPDLKRFNRIAKLPAGGAGVRIHDVAATPSGFIAVGGSGPNERESGVVWVSPDGLSWTAQRRVLPEDASSAGLRHVVAREDRVVAVGTALTDDGSRPFSAVSLDEGETWEYSWMPAEEAAVVLDLTAGERGLVAVGSHGRSSEGDSSVWASADGLAWQRHALVEDGLGGAGAQWLGAVTISGQRVIAIGRSTTGTTDNITIWRSTLTSEDR